MNSKPFVDVTGVKVLARYVPEVTFDYGEVRVVDVEDHLWGPAFDPLRDAYLLFTAVRMDEDAGTIVWPDGADLSPEGLSPFPPDQRATGLAPSGSGARASTPAALSDLRHGKRRLRPLSTWRGFERRRCAADSGDSGRGRLRRVHPGDGAPTAVGRDPGRPH